MRVQCAVSGGQLDFVFSPARAPHGSLALGTCRWVDVIGGLPRIFLLLHSGRNQRGVATPSKNPILLQKASSFWAGQFVCFGKDRPRVGCNHCAALHCSALLACGVEVQVGALQCVVPGTHTVVNQAQISGLPAPACCACTRRLKRSGSAKRHVVPARDGGRPIGAYDDFHAIRVGEPPFVRGGVG